MQRCAQPQPSQKDGLEVDVKLLGVTPPPPTRRHVAPTVVVRCLDQVVPSGLSLRLLRFHQFGRLYIILYFEAPSLFSSAPLCVIYILSIMTALMRQEIVELLTVTYTSPSQAQIAQAAQQLQRYVMLCAPNSYQVLESMLVDQQFAHQTKQAVANLVKVSGLAMASQLRQIKRASEQAFNANKDLMHKVEHIFDNKSIEQRYKIPAGQVYVALYALYKFDNPQRLISKCRYYYNTHNDEMALCLIEEYHHTRIPLKFKIQFYQEELLITLEALRRLIAEVKVYDSINEGLMDKMGLLKHFAALVADILQTTTFEKYQTVMSKVWKSEHFVGAVSNLCDEPFFSAVHESVAVIVGTVVQSLGRCDLMHEFEETVSPIKKLAVRLFQHIFFTSQPFQVPNHIGESTFSFLTHCVKYRLIECNLTPDELYSRFLHPNFLMTQQYLSKQKHNSKELWNYLLDLAYNQSSELAPVQHHKLLLTICRSSQNTLNSLRNLIQHFLFVYLPLQLDPNSHIQYPANTTIQQLITLLAQHVTKQKLTECILHHTSTLLLLFISDSGFLTHLNSFICNFAPTLLFSQNPELCFQAMLLYHSYQEDICNNDNAQEIKHQIAQIATIPKSNQPLLTDFCQHIMTQQIKQRPPYSQILPFFEGIRAAMDKEFQWELVPTIEEIFKGYGDTLQMERVKGLCEASFNVWKHQVEKGGNLAHTVPLLSLLGSIFHISTLKSDFAVFIEGVCQIVHRQHHKMSPYIEEVLIFIGNGVNCIKATPVSVSPTIMKHQYSIDSNSILTAFNQIIPHCCESASFVQWLIYELTRESLTPRSTLLLHNVIYYGHRHLTPDSIAHLVSCAYMNLTPELDKFNYTNGKVSLIFLLLLKHQHQATQQVLLNHNWHPLRQRVRQNLEVTHTIAKHRSQNQGETPFINQIYQLVFGKDNVYRWKYEMEVFLILSIQLFTQHLQQPMQLHYANMIFVAIVANLLRAQDFIQEDYPDSGSESDESLNPLTPIQREYRADRNVVRAHMVPAEYKETDYFEMYQMMAVEMARDEGAREWANEIVRRVVRTEKKKTYDMVLQMKRNNHDKFRLIRRVKRQHQEDE